MSGEKKTDVRNVKVGMIQRGNGLYTWGECEWGVENETKALSQSDWRDGGGKVGWVGEDNEFCLGYVEVEMPMGHLAYNVQNTVGDASLEIRRESRAGYIGLGIICTEMKI